MKFTLICLSVFVAAASSAPQFPFFPFIGSPLLPVQPCAQDELGRLILPGGFVYHGPVQENIQIGFWPWGPMGLTPFYPTDPRFLVLPGTGFPVAPTVTTYIIKPTVPITQPITSGDKSKLKPIVKEVPKPVAPVTPVPLTPDKELEAKELPSSTPTVAERSRCRQDYRKKPRLGGVTMVVKGDIASKNEFPFLVALVLNYGKTEGYKLNCGGSLISPTKILTAAHCVTYTGSTEVIDVDLFQVKLGMHFINDTSNDAQQTRNITEIKIHEDYNSDTSNTINDIAILTMDKPVEYTDSIFPVCLVPDCLKDDKLNDDNEQQVTAMGWGNTQFKGNASDFLRFAEFTTVPNDKCRVIHSNLVSSQLCAYSNKGKGTCQGDSGGPLVIDVNKDRRTDDFENSCRFMQVGIVSWGIRCTEAGLPDVYTRVKKYLPWISKHSSK